MEWLYFKRSQASGLSQFVGIAVAKLNDLFQDLVDLCVACSPLTFFCRLCSRLFEAPQELLQLSIRLEVHEPEPASHVACFLRRSARKEIVFLKCLLNCHSRFINL